MSVIDNPDLVTRTWLPYQRNLIYLVKKYPITYMPSTTTRQTKLDKAKCDTAWIVIGTQLSQPSKICKRLWTKIKFRYAKIINLINSGKITKEAAMSHPETGRFFDGLLSFMDPYINTITDENIPIRVHKTINDFFCLKTKQNQYVFSKGRNTQFVTHAQVKAMLRKRQSQEELDSDMMDTHYLQIVVNTAVKQKLEELLLKQDDLLNPSNDTINTLNVPMMPSKNLQNVCKRKPYFTLVPSKNILNNDEENTNKTVNLGLETEFIIEDDIKSEAQDDNMKMEVMEDEDYIKEENLKVDKNINNTTEKNNDLENILPSTQIIRPAVHDTMKNTLSSLNNDFIGMENKSDNIAMMDNNEPPVSDDYIRNFFNELGIVMSLELSICKQKTLKSRINALLKDTLL